MCTYTCTLFYYDLEAIKISILGNLHILLYPLVLMMILKTVTYNMMHK